MRYVRLLISVVCYFAFTPIIIAQGPNNSGEYYKSADGKKGAELKTAMCGVIFDRNEGGDLNTAYKALWTHFWKTDALPNGKVWDMYSNKREMEFVTDQDTGSGNQEGQYYNREHSFPNSWFGGKVMPMYTDLHHMYPTDKIVNNKRSNYPFGETANPSWKSANDFSKLGPCSVEGYSGTVFEPNDEYKGDFARTYFYMVTCYEEQIPTWYTNFSDSQSTLDGNKYPGLSNWQLKMLMKWAKNDPVSEKEINRNNAVYSIQKNRNPFIDYPGLEEYIWGDKKDIAFSYDSYSYINNTTYTLTVSATGNGLVSYNGNTIINQTRTFTVNEGASATITFSPDSGNRIKSIKVNNTDVTSSVLGYQYTISNITGNTNVEVEFEAISPTTYTLSINAIGNGSASYDGNIIRSKTSTFTLIKGTSATITFTPDNGYRIKSIKVNNTDVTSSVSGYQYTISNITGNTNVEVEFEVIPSTTYSLSIHATGSGSVSYNGTTVRDKTSTFTVNEGTRLSISIYPDNGYRIKTVKENDTDVISYVSDGIYTINSMSRDTEIEVEFEVIPAMTYALSIKAIGNGSASYDGYTIRNTTNTFTLNEGTSAKISFSPDSGYRIKSVKVNGTDVTSSVSGNQYTIGNITSDTSVEVEFEAIPVNTYTLNIVVAGNGCATYNDTDVRNGSEAFTVNEGSTVTIVFSPDNGNRLNKVKMNGMDVTSQVTGNSYTINNIATNTDMEVTFKEDVNALTVDGVNYSVVSQTDKTVNVVGGNYGKVLTVPATVTSDGTAWKVVGIEADALNGNTELAAIIWNTEVAFTATVSNPNLLLYVKSSSYAPSLIQNVVVNGTASNIVLKEAGSGNGFYCPQAFTALQISYTHNYQMQTGIGESKGWETIALPFDVQTITHETKGKIVPFAQWNNESDRKPFWLMELTGTGFVDASSIKAYTPYIISMPNHSQYDSQWLLKGKVTFAASSVTIGKTEDLNQPDFNGRTFIPCFAVEKADEGLYALNVINDWDTNNSGMTEGSKFVLNMRRIHPFEAYMISSSNAAPYFDVFDNMTTGIHQMVDGRLMRKEAVYDLQGRKLGNPSKKGVYIVNGKKKIIK